MRAVAALLMVALLLGSVCLAEGAHTSQGVYNPEVAPPNPVEHEPTDDDYFTDAVFVGDSMMEYVELLGEIPTANYVWKIGMGPATVGIKQFRVRGQEQNLSAYEMIATYNPKKVYIMLGGNGLDWSSYTVVIENYEIMMDTMVEMFPDAMFYVISAPPASQALLTEKGVPVGRFTEFNRVLKEMAERRGFYYLDLYSLLADANGYLPAQYDSGDGYHLSTPAYRILVDLVRRTTVPYPTQE